MKQRDGIRDRAMLHLAFAAGLRATELVTLPLAAVTMTGVPCVRVIGKGRKERALPLWKAGANKRCKMQVVDEQHVVEQLAACAADNPLRDGHSTNACPQLEQ